MKTIIFGLLLLISISANAQNWIRDFKIAGAIAKSENKLMLIDFYADWCPPCKQMDRETWPQKEVKDAMDNVVALKVNIDANSSLAMGYSIKSIPVILITDARGNEIYRMEGMQSAPEMNKLLSSLPGNTGNLNAWVDKVMDEPKNPAYNLEVAKTYQSLACGLNDKGKSLFVRNSFSYLNKAGKYYKKQKNAVKQEEIELLKCLNNVIMGRSKKALAMLDKMDIEKVDIRNQALAYFVAIQAYNGQGMKTEAKVHMDHLTTMENAAEFLNHLEKSSPELF